MKMLPNRIPVPVARRDLIKLICLAISVALGCAVFFLTPALSTPLLLSFVLTLLISPLVKALERAGYSRNIAIILIFLSIGGVIAGGGVWATQSVITQWDSFREKAPRYFHSSVEQIRAVEMSWKAKYPFLESVHPTNTLVEWVDNTGKWFLTHGTSLIGDLLTCLFIVPFLTFFLLKDGKALRKKFFELVPNRYFESCVSVTTKILTSFSDYIRAKLLEALIVGVLTFVGLVVVQAPYAAVLAIIAGVTNIIPYAGPILGGVPGVLVIASDPQYIQVLWPVVIVYAVANIIDMLVIFPVLVASLVNLHPVLLIIVVMVGQQYYGLVGMLISIPIATGLKVVFQEVYSAIYENGTSTRTSVPV